MGSEGTGASEATVLRAARAGDAEAVAAVYDRHAAALYALARWLLGPTRPAEDVVVEVVVDVCSDRCPPLDGSRPLREELARLTFQRCAAAGPLPPTARAGGAVALCLHGGHSLGRAAQLAQVTRADVVALLRARLAERRLRRPA